MLESINGPEDLRALSIRELKQLAEEVRQTIVATVVETGGHLGANLGVVELTLALHSVLESPRDKIIWDVGHQCYTHKLVTGRRGQFHTLRQEGGLSGFPKTSESEHDIVTVGHSSTSISSAAGIAAARDLQGEDFRVAAVIGDGALTGGMAFEALNHLGQLQSNVVVIVNDNAMSISRNVGALSDYFNRLRLDPALTKARGELESILGRLPAVGGSVSRVTSGLKDALKSVLPGQLFEELGFTYAGPFDGHNIAQLRRALRDGFRRGGPVLIHVLTQKGRGYPPAEADPARYHGLSAAASVENGETFGQVFGQSVVEAAEQDERIVAVTAAMEQNTGLGPFARAFPTRIFDVGIAEQHAVTFAGGLAAQGMRPVVALYSTFLQRAYDQVLHDICLSNLPVVFVVDRGGVVGDDGPTHHGIYDLSFLRTIPNLQILAPSSASELQSMFSWAVESGRPTAIRYPKGTCPRGEPLTPAQSVEPSVVHEGSDCVVLAVGGRVEAALEAAQRLAPDISCAVVNVRRVKPLPEEWLRELCCSVGAVVTVEDNTATGGFGGGVAELLANESDVSLTILGYADVFVPQGQQETLLSRYHLDAEGIAQAVRRTVESREGESTP